jgi:hypothetical protein
MFKYFPIAEHMYLDRDLIRDAAAGSAEPLHFNDLWRSSCYTPFYCWEYTTWRDGKNCECTVGSVVPCIACGKRNIAYTDAMFCDECWEEPEESD